MIEKIKNYFQKDKFPEIPDSEYIKIRKTDYELMKKMVDRQDNFTIQIMQQTKEIKELRKIIEEKEKARRKVSGKVGGLKKELNKLKGDNSENDKKK